MNVLSLFDGISAGRVALDRAGIKYDKYFASEIDPYAIQVAMKNYPDTIQLGSVTDVFAKNLQKIDLLIGGSPCQGFSFAGKQLNFNDPRSALFFEYVRLLKECKPKYFLLENVRMKKQHQDVITEHLCVEPILINSSLVSAQNRPRLYWSNIPDITQPNDKGLILADILEQEVDDKYYLSAEAIDYMGRLRNGKQRWEYHKNPVDGKAACLTANMYKGVPYGVIKEFTRRLTPVECERLQTVPDNYTEGVSTTQRYKMLGNGWTVDVITHIFKNL
jgi:DNA-cytosine methyltransferase